MAIGTIVQRDFGVGMMRDTARHLIDPSAFFDGENLLLDIDGDAYKRGGPKHHSNLPFGTGLTALWEGFLLPGRRTFFASSDDFGVLASDDATPVNLGSDGVDHMPELTVLEDILWIGGGYAYGGSRKTSPYSAAGVVVTNGSTIMTKATGGFTANVDVGMLVQVGDERLYVVASVDSDTQISLRDEYEGSTATTSITASAIYKMRAADPYVIAPIYCAVQGRLLAASGRRIDESDFTAIGKPYPHRFNEDDYELLPEGVEIRAIFELGGRGLIFTTGGVWVLAGATLDLVDASGNPQQRLDHVSRDMAMWSPPGVAAFDQALVVPAMDGIYLFDGVSSPTSLLRGTITDLYRSYVALGYRAGKAAVYNGHYFLPILTASGVPVTLLVCLLSRPRWGRGRRAIPTFPWSRFSGVGSEISAFAVRQPLAGAAPVLLAADRRLGADTFVEDFSDPTLFAQGIYSVEPLGIYDGPLALSGGHVTSPDGGAYVLRRPSPQITDGQQTIRYHTGTNLDYGGVLIGINGPIAGVVLKETNGGALVAYRTKTGLGIASISGLSFDGVIAVAAPTWLVNTTYWLRAQIAGNVVSVEHWTTDPALGGSPTTTATATLISPQTIDYGAGVVGATGVLLGASDTDSGSWWWDDHRLSGIRARVLNANGYFDIGSFPFDQDGSVPEWSLTTRDYETGDLTVNRARRLRVIYELHGAFVNGVRVVATIKGEVASGDVGEPPTYDSGIEYNSGVAYPDLASSGFIPFSDVAPEDQGRNAFDWAIPADHIRARYVRFRLSSSDPVTKLRLRALQLFIGISRSTHHRKEKLTT